MTDSGFIHQPVTIWSEGGRLAADIYRPDDGDSNPKPAVLLCHGWGGLKSHLGTYGRWFARNGLTSLVFDYRGWGESDGRIISARDTPMLTQAGEQTLRVHVVREVQDPYHLQMDARNAL